MEPVQQPEWWQTGVIYQIYPRSFQDTTGNGVGDLQGIIDRLDYLNDGTANSLGVDAIWISPFYRSPCADFGYDVSDHCDVDPSLGDLTIIDCLIQEAHQRGIRVILDYVPNHTSDQHPWFLEARQSRDNPKRDWYIWRDSGPNGGFPNNWGSYFGGPAWTWDEQTKQYYFHQFLKEQPDLNWRNPEVQAAMMDVLRFWLERGVDGFRIDVVGMIFKHPAMPDQPDNPAAPTDLHVDDIYGRQLHLHDQDQPEVYEMVRQFRRLVDDYGATCLIGEVLWHDVPDRWLRYYGEKGDGLHLPMNFYFMELPWEATAFREAIGSLEAGLPAVAWPSYVLGNHDRMRLASRYGPAGARLAAMLLLTLRGTPILYYGDEIGLENGDIPPDIAQDPWGQNLGYNRDLSRTPMQWNSTPFAGFSTVRPWLPVSGDFVRRNVAAQSEEPTSLLNLYRRLLSYRRQTRVLQQGDFSLVASSPPGCLVYRRTFFEDQRLIALNFTGTACAIELPSPGRIALSTSLDRHDERAIKSLSLRAYEGLILDLN